VAAYVETRIACDALDQAGKAVAELTATAEELGAPMLRAMSDHQSGALQLALGDHDQALTVLRHAWRGWQDLSAPYGAARVRVLMTRAYLELGEPDSASMELDAARVSFEQLGAAADLVTINKLSEPAAAPTSGSILTQRETEVIRLLATGATNREIAVELVISEKTVARHVSNIFTKVDLSSRAAATAYAYEHGLV
jgi:DNA-binding CsgD family transcriptional regulator